MTTYMAKNVLLQLEDGTKVLPYTDKTSRGMEDINTSGEDKLIASEVYKDGILSDVRGAEELEAEKRSTFRGYTTDATEASEKNLFLKVGEPTITDDGIASGFSSNNYINTTYTTPVSCNSYREVLKFKTSSDITTRQIIDGCDGTDSDYRQNLYIESGTFRLRCSTTGTSWNISKDNIGTVQANTEYIVIISYNGTKITFEIYNANNRTAFYEYSSAAFLTSCIRRLGNSGWKNLAYPFLGQIDLSQFSITVDGKEVYHAYDPAITNAYTIPTNSPNDIIYSYKDENNNSYTQRANLTVEQFGNLAANTTSATFPIPFKDTNYTLIVEPADSTSTANPTVGQVNGVRSTTGFTTLAMADKRTYKAKGKIVLG